MDIKILQSFTYLADYISKYVSDNSGNLSNTHVISVSSLDRMYIDALYKYFKSNNSSCISQFRVSTGINLYHRSNRSLEKQISFLTSESSSLLRIWIQTMNNNSTCNEPTRRSTRAKRAPIRPDMTQAHVRKKFVPITLYLQIQQMKKILQLQIQQIKKGILRLLHSSP